MDNVNDIFDLVADFVPKQISKGSIIQRPGEITSKVYIVKSGLLRSYTIDDKGKEHIFMFAPEGWIINDFESQTTYLPTELFIDALEDTEAIVVHRSILNPSKLTSEQLFMEFNRISKRVGVLQKRVIMLMSMPAIARYEHFLRTYPQIVNRIPQRMIASYLGITPEALSNIRGQIAKGK
jgi:CRP-like cAMP-binding protein